MFLGGNVKLFIFAAFFLLSGYCIYLWYAYVYNYQWSESKKMEYLATKDKEVTFNRKRFQDIVDQEQKKTQEYEKEIDMKKDIFGIK